MKQHYFRIFVILIFFFLLRTALFAQCPEFTSESLSGADCTAGTTACDVCAGDEFTLNAGGTDLPDGGTVDWFYSTDPNFNPYFTGTYIGSADISTPSSADPCVQCPEILGLMIDGCEPAGCNNPNCVEDNEFMILSSGSGFAVNDLTIDFPTQNDGFGSPNDDINFSGGNCTWAFPDASLISGTGCNNVVAAGPGTIIPENSPVIIFVSNDAVATFDFSALCASGVTIYVMQSTCDRTIGAFSNGSANGTRTVTIGLPCPCSDALTFDTDDLSSTDGDFVVDAPFFGLTYGNSGCSFPPGLPVLPGPSDPISTVDPFTYTVEPGLCNGGPYYAVGILNPAAIAPCNLEMTQPLEFNVICPIANPISTEVCLNANGDTFIDLTQFETAIEGGSGLPVNWFTDPAGMNPVPPPLNNVLVDPNDPNFYVTIGSGSCISPLETFTVNIVSGPDISNLTFALSPATSCGPADVEVIFTFPGGGSFDIVLDVGGTNWQNSVTSGISYPLGNFNQTTDVTLISVGEGNCVTTLSPQLIETFTLENPPIAAPSSLETCEDAIGNGVFDLTTIENTINIGSGEPVNWFEDMGFTPINMPENYTVNGSTVIFANVGTQPCFSDFVQIDLTVNPAPQAFPEVLDGCDDGNGFADFDLTTLENSVNGGNGNTVTWYETQNTNTIINSPQNYNSDGGSVFAIVSDGQCSSDFVEITLTVITGGMPTLLDVALCETNGLYDLTQLEDASFPIGTWSGNGVFDDLFDPSGQVPNVILTFMPTSDCAQDATTTITVNAPETPILLTADICESDGTIDLNTLVL